MSITEHHSSSPFAFPTFCRWLAGNFSLYVARYWLIIAAAGFFAATDGVLVSALVSAAMLGPGFIAAPLGGLLADRFSPISVLRLVSVCQIIFHVVLLVAVVAGLPSVVAIALLTAVGFVHTIYTPSASITLHSVVPDHLLERSLGVLSSAFQVASIAGALAAAFLLPGSVVLPIAAGVVGNLLLIFGTWRLSPPEGHSSLSASPPEQQSVLANLRDGFSAASQTSTIRLSFLAMFLMVSLPWSALLASKVESLPFDSFSGWSASPATTLGLITALASFGGVLSSSLFARFVSRESLWPVLVSAAALCAVSFTVWSLTSAVAVLAATSFCCAFAHLAVENSVKLIIHTDAPLSVRGRVFGLFRSAVGLANIAPVSLLGFLVGLYGFQVLLAAVAFSLLATAYIAREFYRLEPLRLSLVIAATPPSS